MALPNIFFFPFWTYLEYKSVTDLPFLFYITNQLQIDVTF